MNGNKNKTEKIREELRFGIALSLTILIILLSVSNISAYKLACLTYGEAVPSKENPRYTCRHDLCQICVTDTNYPTHPGFCKDINSCGSSTGNTTIDKEPPALTINSPLENNIYNSRQVLFDLKTDEPASISYIDNINGRGAWKKIASSIKEYKKAVSFKDGLNEITIRATDRNGNSKDIIKKFIVDSTKPKIKKTMPAKGFADGNFEISFIEENPSSLILNYGNSIKGMKTANLDLTKCILEKGVYYCRINVNLNDYNNQKINYWFELKDIANNKVESKSLVLSVDTLAPIINNPDSMFKKEGKYVYFKINITEQNFDEVSYIDNSVRRPRWARLCSRLKNNICEKKITLTTPGTHVIDIQVGDAAGNAVSKRIEVDV